MDGAELDKRVQAMEWLRSDSIGIDQVMDHCEHWEPLVDELAKFALNRYGRRNNNWLKIIPLMMHEMAGQISSLVSSTHDVTVRIDGQKEWQDTMWKAWEDVNTPEQQATPGDDVDVAQLSAEAVGTRLKQLHEQTEMLDPFYIEDQKEYEQSQKHQSVVDEPAKDVDEDLLM